ncbi:DUF2267 domain-containing protein [Microbulbifer sp. GL-2]|uniref:DUF2267 domain-containing protein n=1 Tax=Microbulbifer sp. GL-2 TaxID=2591606 RepID=UPI00116320BC|nr:DUF2267 domain-containing protein [Microbulbifer sp. GL-2]BBM04095.1 hypothetical protein GL2_41690 [Microbulbifer sp. GL-2]
MPVPAEYQRSRDKFYEYLIDARNKANLWSTHVTFTMTQGVFQVFRRRLSLADAIRFSQTLPPCLRALFIEQWDVTEKKKPFADLQTMTQEVRNLRPDHNFSTDTAIQDVAWALRKHVNEEVFDRMLDTLPAEAKAFWSVKSE